MYVLLVGYPPFINENREIVCRLIKAGTWRFREPDWEDISPEAKELIQGLLQVDPAERLSASEALQSKWIRHMPDETLSNRELKKGLTNMKKKRRQLRAAAKKTLTWFSTFHNNFVSKPITTPTQAQESVVEDGMEVIIKAY
jgi:serine/threonine protein kinase